MSGQTTQSIVVLAAMDKVMDVIADFAAYPQWAGSVKSAEVLETTEDGRGSHVRFRLDAGVVKDVYELAYTWAPDGSSVSWDLVKSQVQRAQHGSYVLREVSSGTEATYQLRVDPAIPMIGMFKRKAEKVITDTALKELKKRVEG
ncbi:MAG: SRPBCC family protein [Mycobacteriaceae bacterium]